LEERLSPAPEPGAWVPDAGGRPGPELCPLEAEDVAEALEVVVGRGLFFARAISAESMVY
jgi:hypothetical protein